MPGANLLPHGAELQPDGAKLMPRPASHAEDGMTEPRTDRPRNRSLIVMLLGGLLGLIGLVLAIGGAWLALLGGSLYYLLAGLGLVAAGYLLIRGRALGAYIYIGVFALTLIWALWEVGMNGWALVPRIEVLRTGRTNASTS